MPKRNEKPVFLIGTSQTYPSIAAAAKALGVSASGVSKVVSGKIPSIKGYRLGALSDRVIKVPETGQEFTSPVQAARQLGVKAKKVSSLLSSGASQTTGGYHFVYDVASPNGTPTQTRQAGTATKPKNKKQRKAEKRAKRQAEPERRAKEREAKRKARELRAVIKQYDKTRDSLFRYVKTVNDMIDKYNKVNPALIYYHPAAKDVFGLQPLIGYGDGLHFDDSLQWFDYDLSKDDKERIEELTKMMEMRLDRLITETTQNGKNFFDMTTAWQTRTTWADEFFKTPGHENDLDKYAHMLWDILLILERANEYKELGSDLLFNEISDAMQGDIDPDDLQRFMERIEYWMDNNGDQDDLDEILQELHMGYTPKQGYSVFDDDDGWWST